MAKQSKQKKTRRSYAPEYRSEALILADRVGVTEASAVIRNDLPHIKRTSDYAALRCSNCSGVWWPIVECRRSRL